MRASALAVDSSDDGDGGARQGPKPRRCEGTYLTTDFSALQLRAGEGSTLPLTIYNYGLPPQRVAVTVNDNPTDWKAEIDGSGKPVGAAFVDYDGRANLSLKLDRAGNRQALRL